jgi:hypothetical protein
MYGSAGRWTASKLEPFSNGQGSQLLQLRVLYTSQASVSCTRAAANYFNYTALNYALWSGSGFNITRVGRPAPVELPPPCASKVYRPRYAGPGIPAQVYRPRYTGPGMPRLTAPPRSVYS